jgi:hypothetical protein
MSQFVSYFGFRNTRNILIPLLDLHFLDLPLHILELLGNPLDFLFHILDLYLHLLDLQVQFLELHSLFRLEYHLEDLSPSSEYQLSVACLHSENMSWQSYEYTGYCLSQYKRHKYSPHTSLTGMSRTLQLLQLSHQ